MLSNVCVQQMCRCAFTYTMPDSSLFIICFCLQILQNGFDNVCRCLANTLEDCGSTNEPNLEKIVIPKYFASTYACVHSPSTLFYSSSCLKTTRV